MPGDITMTTVELEYMLDRAAAKGARAALAEIGLTDATAADDIQEMRSLVAAWRDARSTMWQTVVRIGTTALLGFIAASIWWQFKAQIWK